MKKNTVSALCVIGALFASTHSGSGQVTIAPVQSAPARPAAARSAPAARAIPNRPIPRYMASRPVSFTPRMASAYAPATIGQSVPNPRPNYAVATLNPTAASVNEQRSRHSNQQQAITGDPEVRQNEVRTLAAMRERRVIQDPTLATGETQRHLILHDPATQPRFNHDPSADPAKTNWHDKNNRLGYSDAFRRHWHEWHDRNWWHGHCDTIVFVNTGYYFLDGSYWYPAWGYDPSQSYYDYDGPVYTYGDLLPDEVIANVQTALQNSGYYVGAITGSLGVDTRAAIANFQRDYGLDITGAIDEPTIEALGLN